MPATRSARSSTPASNAAAGPSSQPRRRRGAAAAAEQEVAAADEEVARDDAGRPLVNGWQWKPQEGGGFRFQGARAWLTYSQIGERDNALIAERLIPEMEKKGKVESKKI